MKTALVTGANRGIGLQTVKDLAARGYRVFLTARSAASGTEAAASLTALGLDVTFVPLDVDDAASIRAAIAQVESQTGHLDLLVNNAGIYPDGGPGILETSAEILGHALHTNTLGPLLVTQAFLPLLEKSPSGRVVNLSSGLSQLTDMGDMAPAYSISKTALNAVTCQLAAALAPRGIAVNAVCPGWVRTDMGGPGATLPVEESTATILWLADETPAELTGKLLRERAEVPW